MSQDTKSLDALMKRLETSSPAFEAFRDSMPPNYWARYDLSAVRLGWEAALAAPDAERVEESADVRQMNAELKKVTEEMLFVLRQTPERGYYQVTQTEIEDWTQRIEAASQVKQENCAHAHRLETLLGLYPKTVALEAFSKIYDSDTPLADIDAMLATAPKPAVNEKLASVDCTTIAAGILSYLGYAQDPSNAPGADKRRDAVALMVSTAHKATLSGPA